MLKRFFIPKRCLFHGSKSILVPKMTWGKGPKSSLTPKSTKNDMVWGWEDPPKAPKSTKKYQKDYYIPNKRRGDLLLCMLSARSRASAHRREVIRYRGLSTRHQRHFQQIYELFCENVPKTYPKNASKSHRKHVNPEGRYFGNSSKLSGRFRLALVGKLNKNGFPRG